MKNSKFIEAYLKIIKEENELVPSTNMGLGEDGEQCVCFKTSDKNLIDAINSGFDEVVFFVKAKDEETGEDTVAEVKFGPESFKDLEVKAAETNEDSCPECGKGAVENEEDDGGAEGDAGGDMPMEDIEEDAEEDVEEDAEEEQQGQEQEECGNIEEDNDIEEDIDPSEWLEDGICVKCGKSDCDGSCKCEKCGSQNCIGDCDNALENPKEEGTLGAGLGAAAGAAGGTLLGGPIGGALGAAAGGMARSIILNLIKNNSKYFGGL